jgi:hypothetical protein
MVEFPKIIMKNFILFIRSLGNVFLYFSVLFGCIYINRVDSESLYFFYLYLLSILLAIIWIFSFGKSNKIVIFVFCHHMLIFPGVIKYFLTMSNSNL